MAVESRSNQTDCAGCDSCCVNTRFPRLSPGEFQEITPTGTRVVRADSSAALDEAVRTAGRNAETTVHVLEQGGTIQAQIVGRCPRLKPDNTCGSFMKPNRPIACGLLQRGERRCTDARRADGRAPVILPTPRRRQGTAGF